MKRSLFEISANTADVAPIVQEVSIDFGRGLDYPKWDMVKSSYAQDATFLAVAPIFTATHPVSYTLDLTIDNATFVGAVDQKPKFDLFSGDANLVPIDVGALDASGRRLEVRWAGPALNTGRWQRWIYRFYVRNRQGHERPFPLAFVYLSPFSVEARAARATTVAPRGGRHDLTEDATATASTETPTLRTAIRIEGGVPTYPSVFDYDQVTLPATVYPDPMITVLEQGDLFSLEFNSERSAFSSTIATPCNPGRGADGPARLQFLGVNPVNDACPVAHNIPLGFKNSVVEPSTRQCVVSWEEPEYPRGAEKAGRVASFLFCNQEGQSTNDEDKALLDPTLITGLPENPPG